MTEEELVKQLQANTEAIKELKEISLKTAKYIRWMRIMDIVKLLLIVVPLIAAYIYLPMMVKNLSSYYTDLMPQGVNLPKSIELPNINSLLK